MNYLIRTYTKPGACVLDFAMGSGTTGVASRELHRSFIGIEKDRAIFAIARRRLKNQSVASQRQHA
jgi:DNA modification methylase